MADTPLKPQPKAVFLSYAHEDAEAARRIADALRAFGVEVWFDSNELRGGDLWDAKIRSQIKACGLFLPIISQTTQTRREAYFRLEWKLADDRTFLLAPGTPFLVPVVVDDTPEYEATVPESFAKAHWTRLPDGEPTPEFVAQVKRLASDPGFVVPPRQSSKPSPAHAHAPPAKELDKKRVSPWVWIAGLGIIGVVAIAISGNRSDYRPPAVTPPTAAAPVSEESAKPATADRRSIAVLPFANMSEDAAGSSFFADGVHEDLLTNLAFIGDLRVVSRTSVMQYRSTDKSIRQIASELGVGSILEGSVRRAGDRVRVTAQLIDAATDEHLWAQTYDRKIEDIFGIQGELAKSIASALRVALSPEQQRNIEKRPTENIAAYELFLQERELSAREGNNKDRVQKSIGLMQRAIALDPKFALAWANLGVLHAQSYFWYFDRTPGRLELARAAIEKALALAPNDLDVKTYAGSYYYYGYRDYSKAADYYQQVLDVAPNHVDAIASLGFIRRREGMWKESIALHERALEIDPRNESVIAGLMGTYSALRHFDKALELAKTQQRIRPASIMSEIQVASLESQLLRGPGPIERLLKRYETLEVDVPATIWRARMFLARGNRSTEVWTLLNNPPQGAGEFFGTRLDFEIERIQQNLIEDDRARAVERARKHLPSVLEDLEEAPGDIVSRFRLLTLYCVLRKKEAAKETLDALKSEAVALNDALDGNNWRMAEAEYLAWFGTPAESVAVLREASRYPNTGLGWFSKFDPTPYAVIADTTEFKALLDDPDTWKPLPIE